MSRKETSAISHCPLPSLRLQIRPHLKASRLPFRPVRSLAEDEESDGPAVKRETWRIGAARGGCAGLTLNRAQPRMPIWDYRPPRTPRPNSIRVATKARFRESRSSFAITSRAFCLRQASPCRASISNVHGRPVQYGLVSGAVSVGQLARSLTCRRGALLQHKDTRLPGLCPLASVHQ